MAARIAVKIYTNNYNINSILNNLFINMPYCFNEKIYNAQWQCQSMIGYEYVLEEE